MGVEVLRVVLLGTVIEELRHDYGVVGRWWFRYWLGEGLGCVGFQGARPQQKRYKGV